MNRKDEIGFYDDLGEELRDCRQARGWTLYDVAAVVGASAATVSRWERGQRRMHAHHYRLLQKEGLVW